MNHEEQLHLRQLKEGVYASFEAVYRVYSPMLFGYALELTRSRQKADELVQDTFIKVWIHRESIDPDLSFKSFLFRIAQNQLIDGFRQKLKDPLFEDYLFHDTHPSLSHDPMTLKVDFDEFVHHLNRAKAKLTPRQREIFILNKEQGYSPKEVAQALSLSEQTVYNQLHTAMQVMHKEMKRFLPLFALLFYC